MCNNDTIVLLSIGELSERKNHEAVINSLGKIDNKNIQYWIIGRGELQHYLQSRIQDNDLHNVVRLLGFRTNITDFLNAADIFVFPSKQEGLPVALMEAMASGKPVVCSNIRGNTDLINSDGGKLFSLKNPHEVKQSIQWLLSKSEEQRILLGCYNFNHIKKFDKKIVTDKIGTIYKRYIQP